MDNNRALQEALQRAHNLITTALQYGISATWKEDAEETLKQDCIWLTRQPDRPLFPCGNCGYGLDLSYLNPGDRCPSCGCLL